jgi:hypothetical protein
MVLFTLIIYILNQSNKPKNMLIPSLPQSLWSSLSTRVALAHIYA